MKNNILKILILTIILTMTFCCNFAYASNYSSESHDGGGGGTGSSNLNSGNSENMLPTIELFSPEVNLPSGGKTEGMIILLLNVLTVLGIIAIVLSLAFIGFGSILGSAGEKAQGQEKYIGIVIAALIITGGSMLAKFIISIAENI